MIIPAGFHILNINILLPLLYNVHLSICFSGLVIYIDKLITGFDIFFTARDSTRGTN